MKKGKRLAEGSIGKSEMKLFKPDVTTSTMVSDLRSVEYGQDRIALLWSNREENDQPRPNEKWIIERQSEQRRRARQ